MCWWRTSRPSAPRRRGASGDEPMTARAIVLDANILVRAVLGSRVPELLAAHAAQATFLAPDIAFDEAREHLPTILAKRGKSAEAIHAASCTCHSKTARWRASDPAIPKTGRCWHVRSRPIARSGPRTPTSLAPESQHGPRPASNCSLPSRIEASGTRDGFTSAIQRARRRLADGRERGCAAVHHGTSISRGRRARLLQRVSRCARGP
jgi:PIN domain